MEHLNRIELRGRVGTVRTNEVNGSKVANFSLVSELLYKTREGASAETTWHNVVVWESKDNPDIHKIAKGVPVNVVGRLRTQKVTNLEGTEKTYYEVLASKVRVLAPGEA